MSAAAGHVDVAAMPGAPLRSGALRGSGREPPVQHHSRKLCAPSRRRRRRRRRWSRRSHSWLREFKVDGAVAVQRRYSARKAAAGRPERLASRAPVDGVAEV